MHPAIAQHRKCLAQPRGQMTSTRATSDVDFLIEFAEGTTPGLQDFIGAKTALEHLLGRAVDLIEPGAARNREAVYAV